MYVPGEQQNTPTLIEELLWAKDWKALKPLLSKAPSAAFQLENGASITEVARYTVKRMKWFAENLISAGNLDDALDRTMISHTWIPTPLWETMSRMQASGSRGKDMSRYLSEMLLPA